MRSQWTPGHLNEWQQSVDRLAGALMDKPTANLTQTDVVSVIKPIWATTNETARRVLGRIDQTIEHAMAVDPGRFSGSNPCNNVLRLLPRVSTVVKPRPAIPWRDLPIFFSLAPTPGGSGTRARTVVARLLPQNWRSHAGDVERDRRQPKARTCRAQETRWRTDDPFERCCDGSAGQHQATRAPMGQDLVADDQVLHQHLAGRRGDPRARTEAKNTNIRAVADGVLRDDEWRAVADSSEIQRLILDAPLVTVSKPLAPLAVAPGANGNAVSSIVSPITNPPIVALTAPACSAIRTPALPWKVIVAPGAVPFTSSVAPLSIRTPPPPARGPDSFSSPDLAPHDVQSLLVPTFRRSEIIGFLAGFGTTFAAVPDLITMTKRRSGEGMNPRMAAIVGSIQILWVYYGLLIAARLVIAWNIVAVLINFLCVGAYIDFVRSGGAGQRSR
jgi:uncharacterized protein with PQ loop repeat